MDSPRDLVSRIRDATTVLHAVPADENGMVHVSAIAWQSVLLSLDMLVTLLLAVAEA